MITHLAIYDTDGRRYYPPRSSEYEFPRLRSTVDSAQSADGDACSKVTSVIEPLVDADIVDCYADPDLGLLVHRFRARPSLPGLPSRSQEHFAVFLGVDPRYHPQWVVGEEDSRNPYKNPLRSLSHPDVGTDGGTVGAVSPVTASCPGSVDADIGGSVPFEGAGELLASVLRRDDWACCGLSARERPTDPGSLSLYAAASGWEGADHSERTLHRRVLRAAVDRHGERLTVGVDSYRDAVRLLRLLSDTGATVALGQLTRPNVLDEPDIVIRYGVDTDTLVAADDATRRRLRQVGSDIVSTRVDEAFTALDTALSHLPTEEDEYLGGVTTCDRLLEELTARSATDSDTASHVETKATDAVRTLRAAEEHDGPGSDRRRFRPSYTEMARYMIRDRRAALRELAVDAAATRIEERLDEEATPFVEAGEAEPDARREILDRVVADEGRLLSDLHLPSVLLGTIFALAILTLAFGLAGVEVLMSP